MAGEELLSSYQPPPPKPPRTGDTLWTLTKEGVGVTAELLDQSSAGVELRMHRDGEWLSGRRFSERANAIAYALKHREQLTAKGWREP